MTPTKKTLLLSLLCASLGLTSPLVSADISNLVNYQGSLTDNTGQPIDGTVNLTLTLWDALTGGSVVGNAKSYDNVDVKNGLFSLNVDVGDTTFDRPLYVETTVNGETLSPRQLVTGTPPYWVGLNCTTDQIIKWDGSAWVCADLSQTAQNNGSSLPAPDYESEWFTMKSQAGTASFKELTHGLGVYPSRVKVLVKAIDGPNEGFIFEGTGSAQNDDDGGEYGGLIFAYNDSNVRLWAPDVKNGTASGRIFYIYDGWGGEINNHSSNEALVKVKAWR